MIPFFDLKSQYANISTEIKRAIDDTLDSGWFVLGERVKAFEAEFGKFAGSDFAAGVGSGTDALILALRAIGVTSGDEVITVPNTAIPTISAIRAAGAEPVFVDIDPSTFTMNPALLAERLEEKDKAGGKVKAIIPVHLYGQTAEMDKIMELAEKYGVHVIEDACQAHGAEFNGKRAGSIGIAGAFSFYPSKNLGCYGDGGMITTDDQKVLDKIMLLRNYGQSDRYHSVVEGINSRLDEIQAAVLSVKLAHLDSWIEARRGVAALYNKLLDPGAVTKPTEAAWSKHSYHLYVVRHPNRDALQSYLSDNGVATLIHYPIALHLQEAYSYLKLPVGSFPEAERATGEILSLPIYPELTESHVEEVASLVNGFGG